MLTIKQKAQALDTVKRLHDRRERIDTIVAMREYRKAYGERIDHHEFGWYFDELVRKGLMIESRTTRGYDGFTVYELNTTQ